MIDNLTPIEKYKFSWLNHSLEINELKNHYENIPIESYINLLDAIINLTDMYAELDKRHDNYVQSIENIIGKMKK